MPAFAPCSIHEIHEMRGFLLPSHKRGHLAPVPTPFPSLFLNPREIENRGFHPFHARASRLRPILVTVLCHVDRAHCPLIRTLPILGPAGARRPPALPFLTGLSPPLRPLLEPSAWPPLPAGEPPRQSSQPPPRVIWSSSMSRARSLGPSGGVSGRASTPKSRIRTAASRSLAHSSTPHTRHTVSDPSAPHTAHRHRSRPPVLPHPTLILITHFPLSSISAFCRQSIPRAQEPSHGPKKAKSGRTELENKGKRAEIRVFPGPPLRGGRVFSEVWAEIIRSADTTPALSMVCVRLSILAQLTLC